MRILKKLLGAIAAAVLLPVLLFEEWGWEPLARALHKLSRLTIWAYLENRLRALPSWGAVLVFFATDAAVAAGQAFRLFLLGEGHAKSAVILLLAAKVVGTAILAWLLPVAGAGPDADSRVRTLVSALEGMEGRAPRKRAGERSFRAVRSLKNSARRWWRSMRRPS